MANVKLLLEEWQKYIKKLVRNECTKISPLVVFCTPYHWLWKEVQVFEYHKRPVLPGYGVQISLIKASCCTWFVPVEILRIFMLNSVVIYCEN